MSDEPVEHLYVHVPFCPSICPFCSFEVTERRRGVVDAYLDRLEEELACLTSHVTLGPLRTIYLGGGTPSHLRDAEFDRLINMLDRRVGPAAETTLEVHPATVSPRRVRRWLDAGVTRFSLGVESTDDEVLSRLGRRHDATTVLRALDLTLEVVGPDAVVAADLIVAVERQDVRAELAELVSRGVSHLSAYVLTIEADTPFEEQGVVVDSDASADALDAADEVLSAAGFERYEISNHARGRHRCEHNLAYWDNRWWAGVGPGAASHLPPAAGRLVGVPRADPHDGVVALRWTNPPLRRWLRGERGEYEQRDRDGYVVDGVIAGLRRSDGVDVAALGRRVGIDAVARHRDAIGRLERDGLIGFDGCTVRATARGVRLLDRVAAQFVV